MEVSAALRLYEKSQPEDYPFRYKVFVGDGDANVHKHILDGKFYGDDDANLVQKEECIYHFRKRVSNALTNAFENAKVMIKPLPKADKSGKGKGKKKNSKAPSEQAQDPAPPVEDQAQPHVEDQAQHRVDDQAQPRVDDQAQAQAQAPAKKVEKTPEPYPRYMYREQAKVLSHRFANLVIYVLRKTVRETEEKDKLKPETFERMSNAIRAIPRHYLDHRHASYEERVSFHHQFCDKSFCNFMKCDGEEAKRQYKIQNKRGVDVDGDLYKDNPDRGQGMDEAYQKIIDAFDGFSSPVTMSRCTRLQNTNINESAHARLYRLLDKTKFYGNDHVVFCVQEVINIHNHGYEDGSLLNKSNFDMTQKELNTLKYKDNRMMKKAEKNSKRRIDTQPQLKDCDINYDPGRGFEDNPPLLRQDEFEARETRLWHKDPTIRESGRLQPPVQSTYADNEFDPDDPDAPGT